MKTDITVLRGLVVLLALVMPVLASGAGVKFKADNINYEIVSISEVRVSTGNKNVAGAVIIPEKVSYEETEYSVTAIAGSAFLNCTGITLVEIPASVVSVGSQAFSDCVNLKEVIIAEGETVLNFDTFAFVDSEVETLHLGRNISFKSYSTGPFYQHNSLVSLTVGPAVTSISNSSFSGCSGLTAVELPNSVTSIGSAAFNGCSGLNSVIIPGSVTEIGSDAFKGCPGLEVLEIPGSVTEIGNSAFEGCSGLKEIILSDGEDPLSIGSYVFKDSNPERIYLGRNLSYSFGGSLLSAVPFINKTNLAELTVGHYVTSVGDGAFAGAASLEYVFFEGTLNPVESPGSVFEGCRSGLKVYVPGDGFDSFANFDGVSKVYAAIESLFVESSEVSLEEGTELSVPLVIVPSEHTDPVITLEISEEGIVSASPADGKLALTGLREGTVELTLTSAQPGLAPIKITVTVTEKPVPPAPREFVYTHEGSSITYTVIDEEARTCRTKDGSAEVANGLTGSIVLPSEASDGTASYRLTGIGAYSFANSELSSITISRSVTSVGEGAFAGAASLEYVFFEGTLNPVESPGSVFEGCSSGLKVYVPGDGFDSFANFDGVSKVYAAIESLFVESSEVSLEEGTELSVPLVIVPSEHTDPVIALEISEEGIVSASPADGKLALTGLREGTVELTLTSAQPGLAPVKITVTVTEKPVPPAPREFVYTHEGSSITYTVIDEEARTCRTKEGSAEVSNSLTGSIVLPSEASDGTASYRLTGIGAYSFANSELSSITIPRSVTSVGEGAFAGAASLEYVFFEGMLNPVESPGSVFEGCSSGLKVYVPGDGFDSFANFDGVSKVYAAIESLFVESSEVSLEEGTELSVPLVIVPSEHTDPVIALEISEEGIVSASLADGKLALTGLREGTVELTLTSAQPGLAPVKITVTIKAKEEEKPIPDRFDIDENGVVDVRDVVNLVDKIIKSNAEPSRHDLNGDGDVNVSDIVLLVNRILHSSGKQELTVRPRQGGAAGGRIGG